MSNELQIIFDSARHAVGDFPILDATDNVRGFYKRPAASVAHHSLRTMQVPAVSADARRIVHTPLGTEAGKRTKLSDAVLAASRCAVAGARLVIIPTADEGVTANNGELLYTKRETRFDCIEAAEFSIIPDGDELTNSALPIHRALVDLETMPSLGVRIPLSRAEQKSYADGQLADATVTSIAMGIARAADAVLLSAILAQTPPPFTLGAAAALGVEFAELRALVGTAATGAAVGQDGTLRVAGVLAELTPDTAATVVGAFNRSAIAVHEDIALMAERLNVNGDLVFTAWVSMQPLLPVPGAFWTVAA